MAICAWIRDMIQNLSEYGAIMFYMSKWSRRNVILHLFKYHISPK